MTDIKSIENAQKKSKVTDVKSGDVVRVHQKIKEGSKERVQVFEGLVILTRRSGSHTSTITVRRIASGVGVEKTFLLHSPLITQVEVVKRSKVRRNYLSYMRERAGKSARLESVKFSKDDVNVPADFDNAPPEPEESAQEEAAEPAANDKADEAKDEAPKEESKEEPKAEKADDKNETEEKSQDDKASDKKDEKSE